MPSSNVHCSSREVTFSSSLNAQPQVPQRHPTLGISRCPLSLTRLSSKLFTPCYHGGTHGWMLLGLTVPHSQQWSVLSPWIHGQPLKKVPASASPRSSPGPPDQNPALLSEYHSTSIPLLHGISRTVHVCSAIKQRLGEGRLDESMSLLGGQPAYQGLPSGFGLSQRSQEDMSFSPALALP